MNEGPLTDHPLPARPVPGKGELLFLPLGGTGEIGMNLNLYGYDGRWLMVDLGITFGTDRTPGVDVIMPDPAFIEAERDRLAGLVLTHAHEDHIGAVPYLLPRLRCPIYATAFTAAVLRRKLAEVDLLETADITEVPLSGRFAVGPFDVELVTLTHSIPEPNAVVIRTPAGRVLHTGDWKLDPDPLIGQTTDEEALARLGEEGVLAMVCDSTNALVEGESGSEAGVRDGLMEVVGALGNRVAVACFATNVARLDSIARVAQAHGRRVALVGRSLWRISEAARETGYLQDLPPFLTDKDVGYLPRHEVLMICTGSQGEPRSALSRIANDDHPEVVLEPGDAVVFSSRVIPGNELAIGRLKNRLVGLGIEVISAGANGIHVSGHPARDELVQMYQWVRPKIAIPVHGEPRHLVEHARLAEACQVPQSIVGANGALIRLAPGPAEIVGHVESGCLALEGGRRLVSLDGPLMRERRRMIFNGSAVVTLVMDGDGALAADPMVTTHAVYDPECGADDFRAAVDAVRDAVERLPKARRRDDDEVREAARRALRRSFLASWGRKPLTDVHLVRVGAAPRP
jgi:ribonuclease J